MISTPLALISYLIVIISLALTINLSLIKLMLQLKYFYVILCLIMISRWLTVPGDPINCLGNMITWEGMLDGIISAWRLCLIILFGIIFIRTTRISQVRTAIFWYLNAIPFIPSERIAFMFSLTIRFIPILMEQSQEIIIAQKSRCIEKRKNPFYRVPYFVIPLFRKSFQKAEDLIISIESRCYHGQRHHAHDQLKSNDWLALMIVCFFCMLIYFLDHMTLELNQWFQNL